MPINSLANILRGGVNNTQPNTQSVPYEAAIGKIKRQRDMANLLRMQALRPQEGQIIGGGGGGGVGDIFGQRPGIYVGNTPAQAMMRGLTGAAGQVMDRNTDVQEQEHEKRTNEAYSLLGQGEGTTEELLNSGLPQARQIAMAQIGQRPALKNALEMKQAEIEAGIAKAAQREANINARTDKNIEAVDRRFNLGQDRADARKAMRGGGAATEKLGMGINYIGDEGKAYRTSSNGGLVPVFDPETGEHLTKSKSDKVRLAHEHNSALRIMVDEALTGAENNPEAFGLKTLAGMLPFGNLALNGLDSKHVNTRLLVDRLSSMQVKEFSGAAVSAHEQERLNNFLPREGDDAQTVLFKLRNYKRQLEISGYTMGLSDNLPANPATQPAVDRPSTLGASVKQLGRDLGNAKDAATGAIPKTLTKTLGNGKPQAPTEAIRDLMADPSPEAIAEFGQYFALPPGIR